MCVCRGNSGPNDDLENVPNHACKGKGFLEVWWLTHILGITFGSGRCARNKGAVDGLNGKGVGM